MTVPISDDVFDGALLRSSLRIPPLQDPLPTLLRASGRPSPLEPNAGVNTGSKNMQLSGRQKALAHAMPLGAPEPATRMPSSAHQKPAEGELAEGNSRKKQKLCDHEQIADFVQLPKPRAEASQNKPRPFQPIAVLHELHEPPPSAALFPPITPTGSHKEQEDKGSYKRPTKQPRDKAHSFTEGNTKKPLAGGTSKRVYSRQRTKWTEEETEQLVKGVAIYGIGRWKNILDHPEFTFPRGRTGMDLKDRSVTLSRLTVVIIV